MQVVRTVMMRMRGYILGRPMRVTMDWIEIGGGNEYDCDRDGYEAEAFGGADCNDSDPRVSPSAREPER